MSRTVIPRRPTPIATVAEKPPANAADFSGQEALEALPIPAAYFNPNFSLSAINQAMASALDLPTAMSLQDIACEIDQENAVLSTDGADVEVSLSGLKSGGFLAVLSTAVQVHEALPPHRIDTLTGLPDRSVLEPLFKRLRKDSAASRCALLLIDLDRFKNVNDTLGHPAGDALLQQVVDRLKSTIREDDTLVRLGGDEFALVQMDAKQPEAADGLAGRLVDLISRTYLLDGQVVNIGASIGIALEKREKADANHLLKAADLALYYAKENGRGQHHFFDPKMEQAAANRREMEGDMRKAIVLRQFEVYFQPLADLADGTITGVEALARWNHPTKGMILPNDFIPLAEETGLIIKIGEIVLQKACQAAASWPAEQSIAVNISAVQIESEGFCDTVMAVLERTGLAPSRLELEVTESLMVNNLQKAIAVLQALKNLGVRVVMDDFGTGYSSLRYLQSFAFDKVKIDRSFIANIKDSDDSADIIKAIIDLGMTLGMKTTAEGVETKEQLEQLKAKGCDQVQGYHISHPLPEDGLTALLNASTAAKPAQ